MNKSIEKVRKVFKEISKKPIFVCSDQTIAMGGKTYTGIPRCDYVKIDFEDYNKLDDAIKELK
jgi:hypothetical protein